MTRSWIATRWGCSGTTAHVWFTRAGFVAARIGHRTYRYRLADVLKAEEKIGLGPTRGQAAPDYTGTIPDPPAGVSCK